jgi:RTX calcium-binding nonapeptide repeat (4 copies)
LAKREQWRFGGANAPRRLHGRLQLRPQAQDPRRPHTLRIHLQNLDIRAGSIHSRPDPPDAGTEQLAWDAEYAGTIQNVENVIGGAGNDLIIGDDLNNVLVGSGGDDTLIGGGGNDTIEIGRNQYGGSSIWTAGNSVIFGGDGLQDQLLLGASSTDVTLSDENGGIRITLTGSPTHSVLIGQDVETVQFNDVSRTI